MLPQHPQENGRPLIVPGQLKVQHQYHPGPMLNAIVFQIQQENTITYNVFGGRTNLEDAALQMAAALITSAHLTAGRVNSDGQLLPLEFDHDVYAEKAVHLAKAVMAEARRCDPLIPESPAAQEAESEARRTALVNNSGDRRENAPTIVDSPIAPDDRL